MSSVSTIWTTLWLYTGALSAGVLRQVRLNWRQGDQLAFYEGNELRLQLALTRKEIRYMAIDGKLTHLSAKRTAGFPHLELSGLGESHFALVATALLAFSAGKCRNA